MFYCNKLMISVVLILLVFDLFGSNFVNSIESFLFTFALWLHRPTISNQPATKHEIFIKIDSNSMKINTFFETLSGIDKLSKVLWESTQLTHFNLVPNCLFAELFN